jgi:N-methylhydantoinase A
VSTERVYSDHRGRYLVLGPHAANEVDELYRELEARLVRSVPEASGARMVRTFDARFYGQSWETPLVDAPAGTIDADAVEAMIAAFRAAYERVNGLAFAGIPVEAVTFRVQAVLPAPKVAYDELPGADGPAVATGETTLHHLYGESTAAAEYDRDSLRRGHEITGPAIVREANSTTLVPRGSVAVVGDHGELSIS